MINCNKRVFLSAVIFFTLCSPVFAQSWFMQNVTSTPLHAVEFTSPSTGFCTSGANVIYRTTNSGNSWIPITTNHQGALYALSFPYPDLGYATGEFGHIVKTTNGGLNWSVINFTSETMNAITFINASTGFMCGISAKIYKTVNGGINWVLASQLSGGYLTSINYVQGNTNIIYACGNNGMVGKSTNQGSNWVQLSSGGGALTYQSIFPVTENLVIMVGEGVIRRSTNGGLNWLNIQHSPPCFFREIQMVNQTTGFAAGHSGYIFKTFDAGASWHRMQFYTTDWDFTSLHFANENTGYFTRQNGTIIRTTNGGGSPIGIGPVNNEVPGKFELLQNYPNPFNPSTNIKFLLPARSAVKLAILSMLGEEIEVLVNQELHPGTYEISWDGSSYASGVYYYTLASGSYKETRKMILIK